MKPIAETNQLSLDGKTLTTLEVFQSVEDDQLQISVTPEIENQIDASHQLLQQFVRDNRVIYGVNTSLGGFVNLLIPIHNAQELQEILISAVATNVGPYLDDLIVKATMLARLNSLARGATE